MAMGQKQRLTNQSGRTPVAPPVYGPQHAHAVLQPKPAISRGLITRVGTVQPKMTTAPSSVRPALPRPTPVFNGGVVQRKLDEDFKHGGIPKQGEAEKCHAFAQKVSDFVDQAYTELISGKVGSWKGAKFGTFLKLLIRGSRTTHTHAANAIEERVYALMKSTNMGLAWDAQYSEAMGSVSRPDIIVKGFADNKEALIDITSDREHILGKAGAWTTSTNYIYIAEAWFNKIRKSHLEKIKNAIEEGGVGSKEAQDIIDKAERQRERLLLVKQHNAKRMREAYNEFQNFSDFAMNYYQFSGIAKNSRRTAARNLLKKHNIKVKGMTALRGKRKSSERTKKMRLDKARKSRANKEKMSEKALLEQLRSTSKTSTTTTSNTQITITNSKQVTPTSTSMDIDPELLTPPKFDFEFKPFNF